MMTTNTIAKSTVNSPFQPATRKRAKLRLALDGPAGSGKSYTLLRWAFSLAAHARSAGRPGRVAAIDTERGSLSLYEGLAPDGVPWEFDVVELDTFSPDRYTSLIEAAGRSGYEVLIVDSLSHAWTGKDGALELKDRVDNGNSFTAWKTITPMHTAMIDAILSSPCHVLVAMRSKQEIVLVDDERGKKVPKRIGMAPVQRPGMEYEFSIYGSMDWSHVCSISKSRCPAVENWTGVKPGPDFMRPVIEWLETGTSSASIAMPAPTITESQITRLLELFRATGREPSSERVTRELVRKFAVQNVGDLKVDQATEYIAWLDKQVAVTGSGTFSRTATPTASPPNAISNGNGSGSGSGTTSHSPPRHPNGATDIQLATLKKLRDECLRRGMTREQWEAVLTKRGVTSALQLPASEVEKITANLGAKLDAIEIQERLDRGDAAEGEAVSDDTKSGAADDAATATVPARSDS